MKYLMILWISLHKLSDLIFGITGLHELRAVTTTQTALCVHENLCTVLIPLCKNNLNLSMCLTFFSALCLVTSSSCSLCGHTCSIASLRWFFLFVCLFFFFFFFDCLLLWELIFSPCIKQASFSQSKGWFPLLPTRAINCENCQLFLSNSVINLTQSRTIKLEENKNNHFLSVFNFQQSISESLQP